MKVENPLTMVAWFVSGKPFLVKEFQNTLLTLPQIPDKKALYIIMSQPGKNEIGTCKGYYRISGFPFQLCNEYRTINLNRTAISVFHKYIHGLPVGKHPRIYVWWYVRQVLDFVKEKFGDKAQLSNKKLTLKVTVLLALTTSSRISALDILRLNHMIKTSKYYEFKFRKLHKSWRSSESPPIVKDVCVFIR